MADLLLVDNDARIVELTAWFLERRGHRVRTAGSYAQVRASIAGSGLPDLLLADLELGSERGMEELPRLAAQGVLPPTLVVSGYLDAALERELRALPGVVGTLSKPFDMPELEAAIERSLAIAGVRLAASADRALRQVPDAARRARGDEPEAEPSRGADPEQAVPAPEDDGWIEILPLPRVRTSGAATPSPGFPGRPLG